MRQLKITKERSGEKNSLEEILERQNQNTAFLDKLKNQDFKENPQNMLDLKAFISRFFEISFNKNLSKTEAADIAEYFLKYAEKTEERLFRKFCIWVLRQKVLEKIL